LQLNGGEVHVVFEGLLLRLHTFSIAADARYPFPDVHNVSGALLKDSADALFGIAGVGCLSPAARTSPFCASGRAALPPALQNRFGGESNYETNQNAICLRL
jgi:hypothetical protein